MVSLCLYCILGCGCGQNDGQLDKETKQEDMFDGHLQFTIAGPDWTGTVVDNNKAMLGH